MVPTNAAAAARRGCGEAEGFMDQAPLGLFFLAGEKVARGALAALVNERFIGLGL
jgi:hypothetical protein